MDIINNDGRKFYNSCDYDIFNKYRPKYLFLRGGEGSGKTCTLSVLIKDRLLKGHSTAFIGVDLPMLVKGTEELKRWLPKDLVKVEEVFKTFWEYKCSNGTSLFLLTWKNVNKLPMHGIGFAGGDELQYTAPMSEDYFHVLETKLNPSNSSQIAIATTTPHVDFEKYYYERHWLWRYFGPEEWDIEPNEYKRNRKDIHLGKAMSGVYRSGL